MKYLKEKKDMRVCIVSVIHKTFIVIISKTHTPSTSKNKKTDDRKNKKRHFLSTNNVNISYRLTILKTHKS